jgi:hypothetical protein
MAQETYLEAHARRMGYIDKKLRTLAKELIEKGCDVYIPKDKLTNFIKVLKEDKNITVGFSEVPYRFYYSIALDPSKGNGSSQLLKNFYEGFGYDEALPFSADDVIESMSTNPRKINTYYLQKFTENDAKML